MFGYAQRICLRVSPFLSHSNYDDFSLFSYNISRIIVRNAQAKNAPNLAN